MATPPGFDGCLVDGVELEKPAVIGPNFLFYVPIPPISGQAIGAIGLFVKGDIVRTFEPEDVISSGGVGAVTACGSIFQDLNAEFTASASERRDIFDLCGDGSEMTHRFPPFALLVSS
jgi:hypothetical protein